MTTPTVRDLEALIEEGRADLAKMESGMRKAMAEAFGDDWADHVDVVPSARGYHFLAKSGRGSFILNEIARSAP